MTLLPNPFRKFLFSLFVLLATHLSPLKSFCQDNILSAKNIRISNNFFIENKGQWPDDVLFLSKQNGINAWITKHGVTYEHYQYQYQDSISNSNERNKIPSSNKSEITGINGHVITWNFSNMNISNIVPNGESRQTGYHNYLLGNDKAKWATHVGLFGEAKVNSIYPNINARYYFDNGQLRYDYIVNPNGKVSDIKINLSGSDKVEINRKGELCYSTRFGTIVHSGLFVYQNTMEGKKEVKSKFIINENSQISFEIDEYDKSLPLIVDPLVYSTYVGAGQLDYNWSMVLDGNNVVFCGYSETFDYPTTPGSYNNNFPTGQQGFNGGGGQASNGFRDVVVTKIDPYGSSLVFSTFIGGSKKDEAYGITLYNGNYYITGGTESDGVSSTVKYPTTSNAYSQNHNGGQDVFISVLNAAGTSLLYSTFIGGNAGERAKEIKVNPSGEVFICGSTSSLNYPHNIGGISSGSASGVFVTKIDISTATIGYSNIISGGYYHEAEDIELDNSGNAHICGWITKYNLPQITFPVTVGSGWAGISTQMSFVLGLNSTGNVAYSNIFGADMTRANALTISSTGDIYVIGDELYNTQNFFSSPTPTIPALGGGSNSYGSSDMYVARINPSTGNIIDLRLVGGNDSEAGRDIQTGHNGNIFITGHSASTNYFVTTPGTPGFFGGDAVVTEIAPSLLGNAIFSTNFGSYFFAQSWTGGFDEGRSLALDGADNFYLTGIVGGPGFPTTAPLPYSPFSTQFIGTWDIFALKYCMQPIGVATITSNSPVCIGNLLTLNSTTSGIYYQWSGPNSFTSSGITSGANIPNVQLVNAGIYTLTVTDASGCKSTSTININVGGGNASIVVYNSSALQTNVNCDAKSLEAFPQGAGYTYQWTSSSQAGIVGTNQVLDLTSSIILNPYSTYTVLVTDASGCTATSVTTVLPLPSVSATASPSTIFCIGTSTLVATPTTYPSYVWNPGNINGNPITVSPTVSTIYSVIVTDANNCKNSASTTVTVINNGFCCAGNLINTPGLIPLDNASTSGMGSSYSGLTYFINGTFSINQSISFIGCTLYFTPNAKIVINGNNTLTLDGCTLLTPQGCDMWDGIYSNGGQVKVQNYSTIKDMINGIVISYGAKINCTSSTFTNNRQSIYLLNMSVASNCFVDNNTFQTSGSLKSPYSSEIYCRWGIRMDGCQNLTIGSTLNGNSFNTMYCGIYFITQYGNNTTTFINNKFSNIRSFGGGGWNNQIGINTKGWCLYTFRTGVQVSTIHVFGTGSGATFSNCDKGVYLRRTSGNVHGVNMNNVILGILINDPIGTSQNIFSNSILNTQLGICKNGNEGPVGSSIGGNTITLVPTNASLWTATDFQGSVQTLPTGTSIEPTAIRSRYVSGLHPGISTISGNIISIGVPDHGIGISLEGGMNDNVLSNQIHFLTTSGSTIAAVPQLVGIYGNSNLSPVIKGNTIDNNFSINSNTNYVVGNNVGIYLNKNVNSYLSCNLTNFLKWGILGVDNNGSSTDYTRTVGNTMNTSSPNLLLWELAVAGSFGKIGANISVTNKFDADNKYWGPSTIKVLRNNTVTSCLPSGYPEGIVTTYSKLNPNQSIATTNSSSCKYSVDNPSSFTNTFSGCATPPSVMGDNPDITLLSLIAENQMDYDPNFEEGARRVYEEMAYYWLRIDTQIRNDYPTLDTFYLERHAGIIGRLSEIDELLSELSSDTYSSEIDFHNDLESVRYLNSTLPNTEIFDTNEKYINDQYLNILEFGLENVTDSDLVQIQTLAYTCPYIGGNSVYKARALLSHFSPNIHYDDIVICNEVGVYKNGASKLHHQLNALDNLSKITTLLGNGIVVYPNPASTEVTIEYYLEEGNNADFLINDMLGNKVIEEKLYGGIGKQKINTIGLAAGVYMYQFKVGRFVKFTGKIVIQ